MIDTSWQDDYIEDLKMKCPGQEQYIEDNVARILREENERRRNLKEVKEFKDKREGRENIEIGVPNFVKNSKQYRRMLKSKQKYMHDLREFCRWRDKNDNDEYHDYEATDRGLLLEFAKEVHLSWGSVRLQEIIQGLADDPSWGYEESDTTAFDELVPEWDWETVDRG